MHRTIRLFRRGGLLALLVTTVLALVEFPAAAGETSPPAWAGYAVYSVPQAIVDCAHGAPTAVTFKFHWNAAHLVSTHKLKVDVRIFHQDGSTSHTKARILKIRAHKSGSFSHTFRLSKAAQKHDQVYANAQSRTSDPYTFVAAATALKCTSKPMHALRVPTLALSKVDCHGRASVTFDGRRANQAWYWTFLGVPGGFEPGMHPTTIKPGHVYHHRETHLKAGDKFEVQFNSPHGSVDVGRYKWANGCHK